VAINGKVFSITAILAIMAILAILFNPGDFGNRGPRRALRVAG
jgi:hypothetical protein